MRGADFTFRERRGRRGRRKERQEGKEGKKEGMKEGKKKRQLYYVHRREMQPFRLL